MPDVLFTPFTLNGLTIPNRIVMAPMTRGFSPGGIPGADVAAYYAARAAGGTGLIITEAVAVERDGAAEKPGIPTFDASSRQGWADVLAAVHGAGARIAAQLHHAGGLRKAETSALPEAANDEPTTMSEAAIADTIAAFGRAADAARQLGFDAIEIHGANGNLIDQFLWEGRNTRGDRWGGSLEARTRFPVEVIRAVRAAVGPDFPVLFRISQFKQQDYDARIADTPDALATILGHLVDAGVDAFHASQRRFWEPQFEGSDLNLAGWAKRLSGKPAITVGSVGLQGPDIGDLLTGRGGNAGPAGLDDLRARIEDGAFDLVAVGRAMLSDPNWAAKVRENRADLLHGFDVASLGRLVTEAPAEARAA